MGGGGAMRAAAKIAGINTGLRGATLVDHPIAAAARRAAPRPVGPIVSAPEEVNWSGLSASQTNNSIDAAEQKPCWELEDWELAGGEGDAVLNSREPLPRLVFGGAPTLDEAKEATNELKDALDKIYLSSPNSTGYKEADHELGQLLITKQENMDIKTCVVSEAATKSLPTNALKAFRLLNESSAAQSVVASIASDSNVWNAVLQNEALSEFLQSQKKTASSCDAKLVKEEFVPNTVTADQSSSSSYGVYDSEKSSNSGNVFMDFLEGVRSSVVKMMSGLSDYFQNLFAVPSSEKVNDGSNAAIGATFTEKALGASFFGLAVMVIMLVVLKRP